MYRMWGIRMDNYIYKLFQEAKKSRDLFQMKKLYEENPGDTIICFEYAKMLAKNKNYNEAREIFLSLLKTRNKTYAMLELGRLEFSQGNIDKARDYFQGLLNTSSKTYAMLELGRLEFSQGNIEKARKYFQDLLNTSSEIYAMFELGRLEFSQGNIDKARDYFQGLLNTSSKTYAMLELGRLEFSQGNIDKARDYFQSLLNTQNKTYALLILIKLYVKQNDFFNAFKYFLYLKKCKIPVTFETELEILKLYIMMNLNIFFDEENEIRISYNNSQALDYDEFIAIEHIIDGHKEEFSSGINIYKLFNDIKKKLTAEYKIKSLSLNDIYDIPCENVGENCHILRVVTLPNSKNILTMYPLIEKNYNFSDDSLCYDNGSILQRKK